MKKTVPYILAAVMVLVLVSCGESPEPQPAVTTSRAAAAAEDPAPAPEKEVPAPEKEVPAPEKEVPAPEEEEEEAEVLALIPTGEAASDAAERSLEPEPAVMLYILNTNTKKFHDPDCSSAKTIKDSNRREFEGTREEVIAKGYEPCGKCHP